MGTVRFNTTRGAWFIEYIAANGRVRQTIGPGDEGKRLAKKVLAQREAEVQLGVYRLPAMRTPTFAEFVVGWLERQRARGLRPKTIESDEDAIAHLLRTFREMRLGAISRRDVEAFVLAQTKITRQRRGQAVLLAPATVNKHLAILKAILQDATEQGDASENPAAKVGHLKDPDREEGLHILTPDDIDRLLGAVEKEPWRTLYLVAIHTGLRRGELLALRVSDLDLDKGLLYVRRSLNRVPDGDGYAVKEAPLKTRHSRRTVDLSPTVTEALLTLSWGDDPERDFVFRSQAGGPIDPDNVHRAFKRTSRWPGSRRSDSTTSATPTPAC